MTDRLMRTYIYVDGFNLYYGALKRTPWRWLDLVALFRGVLQPHHGIVAVKYLTARVSATPRDPAKPQRQNVYLRALTTHRPEVEPIFGHFLTHIVQMPRAPATANVRMVNVMKTEEKGSDVNLAVHLLNDAWLDRYDCAVVVSNDSDLSEAMRLVKHHHPQKRIGLIVPGARRPSQQLSALADFRRHIRTCALQNCQLPDPIPGTQLHKPATW